jgi:hypothetical protein
MTEEEVNFCRKLMNETDAVIAGLCPKTVNDAVNWGDLSCRAVEKVESFSRSGTGGEVSTEWRVVIEEASPGASRFQAAVAEGLTRRGHPSVSVVTEW